MYPGFDDPTEEERLEMQLAHQKGETKSAEQYGQKMQLRAYELEVALRELVSACELNDGSESSSTEYKKRIHEARKLLCK